MQSHKATTTDGARKANSSTEATEYEKQQILHQRQRPHGHTRTTMPTTKTKTQTNNLCHRLERIPTISGDIKMDMDPKAQKCSECGSSWRPGTIHKIIMILHGKYTRRCPQCQTVMTFRLIHHVVKVEQEHIDKRRIWKHG